MKIEIRKSTGGGVPFARKAAYEYDGKKYEADLQNGDVVTILDGGVIETGQFGEQRNFKIKTRNGDKKVSFNQQTLNVLATEFGGESEDWVNKSVNVILKKDTIAGKKVIIPYFVTDEYSIDDFGELAKGDSQTLGDIDEDEIPFDN